MLYDVITDVGLVLAQIDQVTSGVPNPGRGQAPPGSAGFVTILRWAAWIALGICVLGVIVTGAMMAISSRRGEGGEHATRLGWVLAACIVIGSASGIVRALI